jgi:hypothetical protein
VSGLAGPGNPESLYDHALRLHRLHPDTALPRDGEPYPDDPQHQHWQAPDDRRRGMQAAAVLDAYFARPGAQPGELAWAFHDTYHLIHHNEHIAAAALRADRHRVQQAGRWLVRRSPDRCSALTGLALLASGWAGEDTGLIKIIGLLSDRFAPLAAAALKRRTGGVDALLWLAERSAGWGRVYTVEALCQAGGTTARPWLLRRACDGDYLNGYFAGKVATTAHVHEAITAPDADDQVIDHTGRLLKTMAWSAGMGMTWQNHPPIRHVLDAHAGHLTHQAPSMPRYLDAVLIADHLAQAPPGTLGLTPDHQARLLNQYLAILRRPEWSKAAQAGYDPASGFHTGFKTIASRLQLPALTESGTTPVTPANETRRPECLQIKLAITGGIEAQLYDIWNALTAVGAVPIGPPPGRPPLSMK